MFGMELLKKEKNSGKNGTGGIPTQKQSLKNNIVEFLSDYKVYLSTINYHDTKMV